MPRLPAVLLSVTLGAAAAALVACGSGGGGSIPATQAEAMLAQLSTAASDQADGNCDGVQSAAKTLSSQAGQIRDAKTRHGIQAGAANLHKLANKASNCGEEPTTTSSTTTPTTTTPTTTTTSTTRSTTTKPPTTTTKPPTTTTSKPPPPPNGGISD